MNQDTVTLTREMFEKVHEVLQVAVPEEVIVHYTSERRLRNDFTRTIINICENNFVPELVVQISPAFATQIIVQFNELTSDQKVKLEEEIRAIDAKNFNWFTSILSYLLIDGARKYNIDSNTFQISIIETAYKKLRSDVQEMTLLLRLWNHCGGWGGLVLRGANRGYDSGGSHDQFAEVEYNGEQYAYSSNYYAHMERHHVNK